MGRAVHRGRDLGDGPGLGLEQLEDPRPHDRLLADDLAKLAIRGVHATGTSSSLSIIAVIWASV